jgi:hypothetical protein
LQNRLKDIFKNWEIKIADKYMKNMFNIFSHQGNANQKYAVFPSHIGQNAYHKGNKKQQMLVRMWEECGNS